VTNLYATFPGLTTDRPSDGVLRITIDGSGLNAVTPAVHRELADIWLTVDRDPTRVSRSCGVPARHFPPAAASNCSTPS
jgi:enoyl-CoA hydratase/carnithine racemase